MKCETHSAPTLASVVLPKFSGLSPVGKKTQRDRQALLDRKRTPGVCDDEAMEEQHGRDFPDCSMKLESRVSETSH